MTDLLLLRLLLDLLLALLRLLLLWILLLLIRHLLLCLLTSQLPLLCILLPVFHAGHQLARGSNETLVRFIVLGITLRGRVENFPVPLDALFILLFLSGIQLRQSLDLFRADQGGLLLRCRGSRARRRVDVHVDRGQREGKVWEDMTPEERSKYCSAGSTLIAS